VIEDPLVMLIEIEGGKQFHLKAQAQP